MAKRRNSSDPPAGAPRGRSGSRAAEPQTVGASITDLRDWRYRQALRASYRALTEAFGHPRDVPPCTGVCECWGAPLGGWPQ